MFILSFILKQIKESKLNLSLMTFTTVTSLLLLHRQKRGIEEDIVIFWAINDPPILKRLNASVGPLLPGDIRQKSVGEYQLNLRPLLRTFGKSEWLCLGMAN